MKKISVLMTVMCAMLLFIGTSYAQNNKEVILNVTVPWEGEIDCVDEVIVGEDTYIRTQWNNKIQLRYKGEYIGQTSGKKYNWSFVQNITWKDWVDGATWNKTNVGVNVMECEGVPVAIAKYRFHVTINAKGEVVVDREVYAPWECL